MGWLSIKFSAILLARAIAPDRPEVEGVADGDKGGYKVEEYGRPERVLGLSHFPACGVLEERGSESELEWEDGVFTIVSCTIELSESELMCNVESCAVRKFSLLLSESDSESDNSIVLSRGASMTSPSMCSGITWAKLFCKICGKTRLGKKKQQSYTTGSNLKRGSPVKRRFLSWTDSFLRNSRLFVIQFGSCLSKHMGRPNSSRA